MDEEYITEAQAKLAQDTTSVPEFWVNKYRNEAAKNWDKFYKRNTTNFFKDRHWVEREFNELRCQSEGNNMPLTKVLEVGCGVGNFVFPVLEANDHLYFYACDFSARAIEFVKAHPGYNSGRCHAFVCDLTKDPLTDEVPADTVDLVSMIFVLSAIPPEKMVEAVRNVYRVLKPNGKVLFRDYGIYDAAQLRFKPGSKLCENFYVRQDGTMAYYFSEEMLKQIFTDAGFQPMSSEYVMRKTTNVKSNIEVDRIFVQAKFMKPA
ncbi:hypothetical protein IWQ62_003841 [Dispira parvispora]|uniref:tRNA N(3)-methylcytidine methyltransferase n=1 Tax=Dispira parvispora TaxID=1520584 RepID=A0A9W8ATG3_9FUNG|nr:hypothetical protein IWQ62_003841 [Dispira parvispora]